MKKKLEPANLARPGGAYSHGLKVSCRELVFVAGQIPVDKKGKIVGVDPSDGLRYPINLETQIRQIYLNVIAVLEEAGASVRDIVRLDTYVAVSAMNKYREIGLKLKREMLQGSEFPGATVFVNTLMITNALLEIGELLLLITILRQFSRYSRKDIRACNARHTEERRIYHQRDSSNSGLPGQDRTASKTTA